MMVGRTIDSRRERERCHGSNTSNDALAVNLANHTRSPAADVRAALRAYLVDACFGGEVPADYADDSDLIALGLMDSLTLMGLATYLEEHFGLALGAGDLVPQHFRSVNALTELVISRSDPQ